MALPLFPLPDFVLLPGLILPLYIFEPRYRELLARVRASGEPFGILRLLPPDGRAPFSARVARVGSLAHLREVVDHEDGTASIVVMGGERFEVLSFDDSRSYLAAEVRMWPLAQGDSRVMEALSRKVLDGALNARRAGEQREYHAREQAPQDPVLLATYCAALLPLSGEQREEVLRAPTLAERFETLAMWVPARTLN